MPGSRQGLRGTQTATIAQSSDTSDEVSLVEQTLLGLIIPASMTGTSLTFLMSTETGGTFVPMKTTANANISVTIGSASVYIPLNPTDFVGVESIKIKSAQAEAAEREITLVTRSVS